MKFIIKETGERIKILEMHDVIVFGKYKGKTIRQVKDIDAGYLMWAFENIDWFKMSEGDMEKIEDELVMDMGRVADTINSEDDKEGE